MFSPFSLKAFERALHLSGILNCTCHTAKIKTAASAAFLCVCAGISQNVKECGMPDTLFTAKYSF
jgi:hypothetical protein